MFKKRDDFETFSAQFYLYEVLEESNSLRQKVEWWLPGASEREKWGVIV